MLVSSKELFNIALRKKFAIPATNFVGILYIASWFAPYFSELAAKSGAVSIQNQTTALWNGNVFDLIIAKLGGMGAIGIGILIIGTIPLGLYVKKVSSKKEKIYKEKVS